MPLHALQMDYFAHSPGTAGVLERLAGMESRILACMHGSAWRGDGAAMLGRLSEALDKRLDEV